MADINISQIQKRIISAIEGKFGYVNSPEGQTTSILFLQQQLADIPLEKIGDAIRKMEGVEILDSGSGAVHFPPQYFK